MSNPVTYKHHSGATATYSAPHPILEKSEAWTREEATPPAATVEAVLAEVGQDPEKAAAALEAERSGRNRSTLISKLEAIANLG